MSRDINGMIEYISSSNIWDFPNFSMTKEKDVVHIQIKKMKMTIPLEKFKNIIEQQSGQITINKFTFKVPKQRERDGGYIQLSITNPAKKTSLSDGFRVIHYNSSRWHSFVDFLRNQNEIFSICFNEEEQKWEYNLSNEEGVHNDHYRTNEHSPTAFDNNMFSPKLEEMQEQVNDYLKYSSQPIITDNYEKLKKSLKMDIPKERVFDVEKFYGITFEERLQKIQNKYGHSRSTVYGFANQKRSILQKTYYLSTYGKTPMSVQELTKLFMTFD